MMHLRSTYHMHTAFLTLQYSLTMHAYRNFPLKSGISTRSRQFHFQALAVQSGISYWSCQSCLRNKVVLAHCSECQYRSHQSNDKSWNKSTFWIECLHILTILEHSEPRVLDHCRGEETEDWYGWCGPGKKPSMQTKMGKMRWWQRRWDDDDWKTGWRWWQKTMMKMMTKGIWDDERRRWRLIDETMMTEERWRLP